jgi:hypothetical protein
VREVVAGVRAVLAGAEGWVVGGALRDELLGRPVLDVDIACGDPEHAARDFARTGQAAPFPLSERHGAWRVVLGDGRTVDFTPLPDGIDRDLASRDFTLNAMAQSLDGSRYLDPFDGRRDISTRTIRAVGPGVFEADPLRLLRAVRLEDELAFRCEEGTEALLRAQAALVSLPAGERILAELDRMSAAGMRRLDDLGLLERLGGSSDRLDRISAIDSPGYRLVCAFGEQARRLPISRRLDRYVRTLLRATPPPDESPRAIHRFRRTTEPWAVDALAYAGASELAAAIEAARAADPATPLVRGDELGLPPGPEIGRLLDLIEEERAAGTIETKDDALAFVRRHARS